MKYSLFFPPHTPFKNVKKKKILYKNTRLAKFDPEAFANPSFNSPSIWRSGAHLMILSFGRASHRAQNSVVSWLTFGNGLNTWLAMVSFLSSQLCGHCSLYTGA